MRVMKFYTYAVRIRNKLKDSSERSHRPKIVPAKISINCILLMTFNKPQSLTCDRTPHALQKLNTKQVLVEFEQKQLSKGSPYLNRWRQIVW